MATRQELLDGYKGLYNSADLPIKLIQSVIRDLKTFLLGDSYNNKIDFIADEKKQQEGLLLALDTAEIQRHLSDIEEDVLTYGDGYLLFFENQVRHIRGSTIVKVETDPDDPTNILYLEEKRKAYDPVAAQYKDYTVKHTLAAQSTGESPFDFTGYRYTIDADYFDSPQITNLDKIPIVRFVDKLIDGNAVSPIEGLIQLQLEYNENHTAIHQNGRHHKPIPYSIGTSGPLAMGTSGRAAIANTGGTDEYTFRTTYSDTSNLMHHFPISQQCVEMQQLPKISYLQPVDSNYLERQRIVILQEVYNQTGAMVLELQNARSASSSSSLAILYEIVKRATAQRSQYLIPALKKVLNYLGIDYTVHISLPNMVPQGVEDDKIRIEEVKNRCESRKSYLMRVKGYSELQADAEIQQLIKESPLNIQYSAAVVDSTDTPNAGKEKIGLQVATAEGNINE